MKKIKIKPCKGKLSWNFCRECAYYDERDRRCLRKDRYQDGDEVACGDFKWK